MPYQGLSPLFVSSLMGVFPTMVNRLNWQSARILRHGLLAATVAMAIAVATPAQAELSVEAAGQLPAEVTAVEAVDEEAMDNVAESSTTVTDTAVGAAPLDLAPLDLVPPPEAPQLLDQMPIDAESRVANRRLVIRLDQRRVYVYEGDTTLVSYPIAVGRQGWETPKGEFEVFQMIKDPSWQHPWNGSIVPPGPDNPLGRRWIGFWTDGVNAIGFHGTPNESLVGQAVSHGCIRMKNKDVANLYAMVGNGTTVTVQ